jgi:hypothetical protein
VQRGALEACHELALEPEDVAAVHREDVRDAFGASREHAGEALRQYPVGVHQVVLAAVQFADDCQGFRGDEGGQLELVERVLAQVDQRAALVADGLLLLRPEIAKALDVDAVDGFLSLCFRRMRREHIDLPAQRLEILCQV